MSTPVSLIPLTCRQCSTPVPAALDEVAWVCAQCGTGLLLDENHGLTNLNVHYAAGIAPNVKGRPFWVARGTVALDRKAYNVFDKDKEAQAFWSNPRQFFIPAYSAHLSEIIDTGIARLNTPPDLTAGPAVDFHPVTQRIEDIRALAEFIIVGYEALRKDDVEEINFKLTLEPPELWILP